MGVPPVASEVLTHPCLRCGACCAFFRASFYWSEADDGGGTVPSELTTQVTPFLRAMNGTLGSQPRCVALEGTIGRAVACSIYQLRSSVCRDFVPSWEDGTHNERCDKARARHGMIPLVPEDYTELRPWAADPDGSTSGTV